MIPKVDPEWKFGVFPGKLLAVTAAALMLVAGFAPSPGKRFFQQGEYVKAAEFFAAAVEKKPGSAEDNFFLGRSYLAMKQPEKAFPFLKKAVEKAPDISEYHFWMGVAHWALMDFDKELESYQKAVSLEPDHLPAHLYMGHNYMDRGLWQKALDQYERVLGIDDRNPEALYNRTIIYQELGEASRENRALKAYLSRYRTGKMAFRAVQRLNTSGDFSFRTSLIGARSIILEAIAFTGGTADLTEKSQEDLDQVGSLLERKKNLHLHIVVYVDQQEALAEKRAKTIKRHLLARFPQITAKCLKMSWFGVPDTILLEGRTHELKESVRFITRAI